LKKNASFTQSEACKLADVYRSINFVKSQYISEFSLLDGVSEKYDWVILQEKYPELKIARNIDHWAGTFGKSKRKDPDLHKAFKQHCLAIKSETSLKRNMNASTVSLNINHSDISIITGNCTAIGGVVPRSEYRKYFLMNFME
jgi:hypothetical protein